MSHYAVAVIHRKDQDIAELLAPYDENIEVEPYFWLTYEEAVTYAREHYDMGRRRDRTCWKLMAEGHKTDKDGNIYSTYNPLSKWDWWSEGRYGDEFINIKTGEYTDGGRIGDLEIPFNEKDYINAVEFWDKWIAKVYEPEEGEEYPSLFKEEYYLDHYKTREFYAYCSATYVTYAVVTPDGEWHAPGDMGWFACSTETGDEWIEWVQNYKRKFLYDQDPDLILTLVDCHI